MRNSTERDITKERKRTRDYQFQEMKGRRLCRLVSTHYRRLCALQEHSFRAVFGLIFVPSQARNSLFYLKGKELRWQGKVPLQSHSVLLISQVEGK